MCQSGFKAVTAAFFAAVSLCSFQASACGYDGTVPDLVAAYPQSIDVAISVRDAFDHSELIALQPAPNALALLRAQLLMRRFSTMVSEASHASTGSVAVLLVESGMWTRYTFSDNGPVALPHVAGPQDGEAVVITSEAAISALLEGKLGLQRAASLGVLVLPAGAQLLASSK
jgi:hypothetical protein